MKKIMVLLLALIMLFGLTGCEKKYTSILEQFSTDENNNNLYISDMGNTTFAENLPCDVKYNNTSIKLAGVWVYQDYNKEEYSYSPYIVLRIDISGLKEDELHWLYNEDLTLSVYITSENNSLDFHSLSQLGAYFDSYSLNFVFFDYDSYRYSFSGAEMTICLDIKQTGTYEYEDGEGNKSQHNKTESLQYKTNVKENLTGTEDIKEFNEFLYEFMVKQLNERADFFRSMLDE